MKLGFLSKLLILLVINISAYSNQIEKEYALMKLLNKTTNKVTEKKIQINKTITWETLIIELVSCYSNPPDKIPEDYVLLDVYDKINKQKINIYRGWMISSLPDVTSLEHPIYDLWLYDCI
tara:strand:- start:44 stop:406 length:363 start_codon:yes stop_codon:yes gene_type:complete